MYNKLPVKERIELMKSYRKANKDMSYRDMVKDYNDSYEKFRDGGKKSVNNNLLSTTVRNDNMLYNNGQSFLNRGMQIEHYPNGVNDTLYSYTKQLPSGEFENFNSSTGHLNSPAFNQLNKNGQFSTLSPIESTNYQNNIFNYFQKHKYGGIQKFENGGEFDDEGSIIKNKLNRNTLAKDERSNQDNTRVSNLPIKTLQALQQQADVERASRQQYKQQPVISQGKKLNPTEQAYSDKVQARIANPSNDLGITAANMASALTRFRYLNPEEIAATTNNPMGTVGLSSGIMTEGLANEMAGPAFQSSLKPVSKIANKILEKNIANQSLLKDWEKDYFTKLATNEKNLQNKLSKKKIDFKQYEAEQELYKQKLAKDFDIGEKIGQGNYGSVHKLTSDPSKVIKIGNPMSAGQSSAKNWTPELIENLKSVKQNANIAIPEQVQYIQVPSVYKNYGPSIKEIMQMPNLNEVPGANLNLNKRDRYALFLKQARQLRDKGIGLDVHNSENFKFNKNKGVFDIYDVNPRNFMDPVAYMQFVKEKTRAPLFENMTYKYGGIQKIDK